MYNSQYYTCEQIDERLLQGYLDDYNTQTGQSLTKAQFLTKLGSLFSKEGVIDNTATQIGYYECDTAAGTAAKAITVANYALFAGGSMKVKFANKNTANNATLNINSQGAKALYYQGERASATNYWDAEEVVEIYYDGTSYYANNVKGGSGSGVYDVSKEHPTSGPNSDGKFTLEYILNSSNVNELIPVNQRYPGMTIQFVSTSDNKYVQYRLMSDTFNTTVANWQGENTFVRTYHDITDTNYTTYLPTLKLADLPVNTVTYISATISPSITDIPNLIDAQIWEVETVSGYSNLSYARTQRAYCPEKGVSYIRHSLNGTSWNTWELMTTPLHSISMYHHIGACGDSFTKGSLYHDGTWMGYRPDLAWCSILARDNGCECTPFAFGGANARQFVSNADCLPKLLSSPCQDIYFLFLGINDAISYHSDSTYLGSSSDINVSDPTQNADTFYGNYGKIISAIKSYAPVAQLVMMTVKYKSDYAIELAAINSAIKAIAAIFEIPVIDLAGAFLYNSNTYDGELYGNHPTPMLHAAIAKEVEKLFHPCAIRYRVYFKNYPSSFTNGTYADRPAANTVNNGATYWDSTNSIVWKSNGTDWERVYPEPLTHGATSARPIGVEVGFEYFDETLDMPVYWNGSSWVNSIGDEYEGLLKDEIGVFKMLQSYEVAVGSIAGSGLEVTAPKRLRTTFIKILKGSKIIVNNRYSKDIRYALNIYNFRKEIISTTPLGDFITVGSRSIETVNYDGYVRLVYQIRGDIYIPSAFISQFPADLQVLTDENSWSNQSKIDTEINDDYVVIKPSFAVGSLHVNTGAEISSTTRVRSAFIKVTNKSYLEIVHSLDRWTGFNIYKYDFNKNYIGYDTTYWGSSQSNISKSTIITKIDVEWEGYIRIVARLYGDVALADYVSALEDAYTDYTDIKDFEIKSLNTKGSIYTYPFGRVTFIYGNNIGDCTILRTNTNKVIMIDLGDTNSNTDYTMQNKILAALGGQVIDKVIISHYHNDHVSNIAKLVEEGNITSHTVFYLPTIPDDFDTIMENMPGNTNVVYRKNQVLGAISNLGCTAIYPSEHDKLILDNITIDFWNCDHSSYYSSTSEYRNYNDCSLCCYATIGTNVICFSGDIQTLAIDKYKNLMRKCSIFKANHHAVTAIAPQYSNHFYSGIYPEVVVTMNGRDKWNLISQGSGGLQPFCEADNIPNYVTGLNGDNIEIEFSEGGYMVTSVSRRLVWSQEEIPQ